MENKTMSGDDSKKMNPQSDKKGTLHQGGEGHQAHDQKGRSAGDDKSHTHGGKSHSHDTDKKH